MRQQGISTIGGNILEFFWKLLYTDALSYLHTMFQVAFAHDMHVEYEI